MIGPPKNASMKVPYIKKLLQVNAEPHADKFPHWRRYAAWPLCGWVFVPFWKTG
jgi:hypothetical protein